MKNAHKTLIALFTIFFVVIICLISNKREIDAQQRQIEELCRMVMILTEPEEDTGLKTGKEYCLLFVDYNKNTVILGEFDGEICYDTKPSFVILRDVPQKIIDIWQRGEIIYGYRKI